MVFCLRRAWGFMYHARGFGLGRSAHKGPLMRGAEGRSRAVVAMRQGTRTWLGAFRAVGGRALCAAWLAVALLGATGCEAGKARSMAVMNEGVKAARDGSYGVAVDNFKDATQRWPKNHQAYYLLGQIYLHKFNQPNDAAEAFSKAVQIDGTQPEYWYQQGAAQLELDRVDEAKASFEKAVQLDPMHWDAFYRLGLSYEKQNDPKKAAASYGDSVRANARTPYAYYNLGDLYFRYGKLEQARQVFENGVANNPDSAELHHGLGVALLSMDRPGDALTSFEKALGLKSPYPSATYNVGLAYLKQGKLPQAKEAFERFLTEARTGNEDNSARVAAAEARLLEIREVELKGQAPPQ